jgi:hypothetical protein
MFHELLLVKICFTATCGVSHAAVLLLMLSYCACHATPKLIDAILCFLAWSYAYWTCDYPRFALLTLVLLVMLTYGLYMLQLIHFLDPGLSVMLFLVLCLISLSNYLLVAYLLVNSLLYGWIASCCNYWCMLLMLMHLNMCSCCFTVIPLHNSCMDLLCNPSWMNGLLMNCICSDA